MARGMFSSLNPRPTSRIHSRPRWQSRQEIPRVKAHVRKSSSQERQKRMVEKYRHTGRAALRMQNFAEWILKKFGHEFKPEPSPTELRGEIC